MPYISYIVIGLCLPLLGFLIGRHFTTARLTGERNRQAEIQDIHVLIDNNRNDVADQVRSIYEEIKDHQDQNIQADDKVWSKLREVDKELGLVSSVQPTPPVYQPQTTTTA